MITLEATKQVADDSPDHICPVGAVRDNFTSQGLIEEVKYGFDNEQIAHVRSWMCWSTVCC